MDYLIDQIPLNLSPEMKKLISQKAFSIITWADWFCGARDVRELFDSHTSLLACEIVLLICSLFTVVHAFRQGGRYVYLWLGTFVFGLTAELTFNNVLDTTFWHAQSFLTFFGRRTPLYIVAGFYPTILYASVVTTSKLLLPWWASGPASGLLSVVLAVPYGLLSTKLLWITWHDTHPNVKDRLFDTPCTFYYFLAAAACSLDASLRFLRHFLLPAEYNWKLFPREIFCVVLAGFFAFFLALAHFIPIYDIFHNVYNVPTMFCLFSLVAFFFCQFWSADRNPKKLARPHSTYNKLWFDELCVVAIFYYFFFMGLVLVVDPYNLAITGMHEPIGPCDVYEKVSGLFGVLKIQPRKYLCPARYNEPYFDFHCLPNKQAPQMREGQPVEWYTQCGTAFQNPLEFVFAVWSFSLLGLFVFYQFSAKSGECPQVPVKKYNGKCKKE